MFSTLTSKNRLMNAFIIVNIMPNVRDNFVKANKDKTMG